MMTQKQSKIESFALKATQWIGSPASLVVHTIFFIGVFSLMLFGVAFDQILLVMTTIVSFEAIYLSIFIQMTVNQQASALHEVREDIEEIQEDVGEIQEDVEEIQEGIEELQDEDDDNPALANKRIPQKSPMIKRGQSIFKSIKR